MIRCWLNRQGRYSGDRSTYYYPSALEIETGVFFKFGVEVGVELSIVNALYRLRITDQLFNSYAFTRMVRSQSTLQRLLRRQI
jgi:hypothetical protein